MFYLSYMGYELKKWMRDSFTSFLLLYPLIIGLMVRYAIPAADARTTLNLAMYHHVILATLALLVPRISGAIAAFSILDDRDDHILYSIKVAPLSLEFYIGLKLFLVFCLSFLGTMFVLWFSNITPLPTDVLIEIAFLSAFGSPLNALLINVVAKNKVEGFAAIKGLNSLVVFSIAALFFFDKKEFLFAFEPGFWPAKALSVVVVNRDIFQLSYRAYYLIGLAYAIMATIAVFLAFKKKVQ